MPKPKYNASVFINCPFDVQYQKILHAIIYTVYRCGFVPRTALDEDDGSENRINKITRIISESKYGIHDLSRIELNAHSFPRFNMPFELGLFFGAKEFGNAVQKEKKALLFTREKFTHDLYISDLSGVDPKAHKNNANVAIEKVRDWLLSNAQHKQLPGPTIIIAEYKDFLSKLPEIVKASGLKAKNLHMVDYRRIVLNYINEIPAIS